MSPPLANLLITGGAGFIGSAFVRKLLEEESSARQLVNLDLLTYAANLDNVSSVADDPRYTFIQGDILNTDLVKEILYKYEIDTIVHFAAESHVDRSICDPHIFYRTNVEGTLSLLEACKAHPEIHFHHVSTDEVYGSIEEGVFTEESPYHPNSPYAASKAASDHFVRAYATTYGLSTTLSHCSNNYGPFQYPEKLIPLMLTCLMERQSLPIYGDGSNVRDWIYVDDHIDGIRTILQSGKKGETYQIGGGVELTNLDLVKMMIEVFADLHGEKPESFHPLVTFVPDRLGHDFRYALSGEKIERELGWKATREFASALKETILWYMERVSVCQ